VKLLYFHVPKTAGSSINEFFAKNVKKYHFHIESVDGVDNKFCNDYEFISGHVAFPRMNQILDLKDWITFATFREPLSYTVSHLKWVRKLADKGEEKRFAQHPDIFQKIALKMTEYDFSSPAQITDFIKWLDSINFHYFHNTQLHYMHSTQNQHALTDEQVQKAIMNMKKIDFVGIQTNLDAFMEMISYEFGWELEIKPRVNVNENNYGFDITNPETQKALLPLYEKDLILYDEAKKLYNEKRVLYTKKFTENIIGYVDTISSTKIRGWARSKSSLKKVKLELKVDGEIIDTTTARIFRQGLKTKDIHPSGLCAFEFNLEKEIKTNNIEVSVEGTDINLLKI
jgi:hypothetical protein